MIHCRKVIRGDHRGAEQVADGGVPQTLRRVVTDGLSLGELRIRAQQRASNSAFTTVIRPSDGTLTLVQHLARVADEVERLIASGPEPSHSAGALRDSGLARNLSVSSAIA